MQQNIKLTHAHKYNETNKKQEKKERTQVYASFLGESKMKGPLLLSTKTNPSIGFTTCITESGSHNCDSVKISTDDPEEEEGCESSSYASSSSTNSSMTTGTSAMLPFTITQIFTSGCDLV